MKEDIFNLELEKYEVGKKYVELVHFPSFYGLQKVVAPVYIYRATKEISPCIVATSCMHGDEINGLGITQTLMNDNLNILKGTLIIVPIINIYGFLNKTRYLPDRKDLNRCFPGSHNGSFGSRFAEFILNNFLRYADVVVDFHSGGVGRFNVPQIRCDLSKSNVKEIIPNISIPLVVNSGLRDGSLRGELGRMGKACIVFEGGEGLRIDSTITKYGVNLFKSVLSHYGMISNKIEFIGDKIFINKSKWLRAAEGGVFSSHTDDGQLIKKGQVIGLLKDIQGNLIDEISSKQDGVILGVSKTSLIMSGDALFNIGYTENDGSIEENEEFYDYFLLDS